MLRKSFAAALAAAALVVLVPLTAVVHADNGGGSDNWLDRLLHREKRVDPSPVIAWSHASSRPDPEQRGQDDGLYIWHDRNTVHVWARGDYGSDHEFRGWVEIKEGKLDSVGDDYTTRDDEFRQVTDRRILFTLTAGPKPHGFRFNLHSGGMLVIATERDGRRTDHVFYGESMADAHGNPAIFNLKN